MNVADLLETPLFRDCTLETSTEKGLLNEVTWTCPSTELRLDRWVMPGLVVICVHRTFEQQRELIEAAGGALSAVVHFGCVTDELSEERYEEILRYYDGRDLPLIKATRRMSVINFARHFSALLDDTLDKEQEQTHWLEDLCMRPYKHTSMGEHGSDINLAYSYACAIITRKERDGRRYDPIAEELAFGRLKDYLSDRLSLENPRLPWFAANRHLVLFIPSPEGEATKSFKARVSAALKDARRELTGGKWHIVVGERVRGLKEFRTSYEHAVQTSKLLTEIKAHAKVAYYDDWFTHIQLLSEPREDLERQMTHVLGPILDEPDLIDSLTNYLFFGENAKLAAEKTFIHTNTMRYRLGRIQELLDVDLKDPTVRFRLRIAVTIYRYLRG